MKLTHWKNIFHVIVNTIVQHVIQIKKWNNETCLCECKNYGTCKKHYSWNPSTCICETSKHLKSIAGTSLIKYDEVIYVMDIVSTKVTDTIATNASVNWHNKKVRYKIYCYFLHSFISDNVTIDNYYYLLLLCKT